MKTIIIIFFLFRSGSSFIMQSLKCCNDVYIYGDYGEILSKDEIKNIGYQKCIKDNLEEYINYLNDNTQKNIICHKISIIQFNNLSDKDLNFLKKYISNKYVKIILLSRNLLDVYISYKKAAMINKWSKVDTSCINLNLNIQEFINWHTFIKTIYEDLNIWLRNKIILQLDYDDIFGTNINNINKVEYIVKSINKYFNLNIIINKNYLENTMFLAKQDNNNQCDKIENYSEICAKLNNMYLDYLIKDNKFEKYLEKIILP